MGKQVTTRTVTTTVVVKEPRKYPKKVFTAATGAAILVGIGYMVGR